ncbi:MAG: DNA internalization-related competence protein ComEC/Rec2 [Xanthomonadales bacterium]|jgi:competence protein ComEC|nr:DNA internalization-related competence protein ComEC/Rec2 [Xanthomonadales bacterium]
MRPLHALMVLAGVLLAYVPAMLAPPPLLGAGLLLFALALWRARSEAAAGWIAAFLAGWCWAGLQASLQLAERLSEPQTVTLIARVVELPEQRGPTLRLTLAPEDRPELPRRIRAHWWGEAPAVGAGERWRFTLKLRPIRGLANPGGYDFERQALVEGIGAIGSVQASPAPVRLADGSGLVALRERLSAGIAALPEPPPQTPLLRALALGDTGQLDEPTWALWRQLGLTHLIAISGLHVTLVGTLGALFAGGVCWLFPRLMLIRPRIQWQAVAALLAATGYSFLAGFGVPAQRTLLMLAAFLLATLLTRRQSAWGGLALALVAVLAIDPLAVLSSGFWLSFVAVAWLVLVFGGRWRPIGASRALVLTQLLMTLALLPLTLVFFQQASVVGPLANLIAVPLVTFLVTPLALLGTALLPWPALAQWPLHAAGHLLQGLSDGLGPLTAVPGAVLFLPQPGALALLLAAFGVVLLWLPLGRPLRLAALGLFLPLFLPPRPLIPPGEVEITTLDVGQGLAVLVQTRHHALLYDTGPGLGGDHLVSSQILPALHALGVRRIDHLVVSHGDADHAAGYARIRSEVAVGVVQTSAHEQLADASPCHADTSFELDGVAFRWLHPSHALPYRGNESSCVLLIQTASRRALLTGDITGAVEQRLLLTAPQAFPVDWLLAPHHGSASSSRAEFVARARPQLAVFSAGADNRFGHPRAEVLARYRAVGAELRLTADSGAIRWRSVDGASTAWREQAPRFWRSPPAATEP